MKLYIAVLDKFPDYMVPTLVAHSVLAAHLQFSRAYILDEIGPFKQYVDWLADSFRKVVVKVNQKEFDKISALDNVYLGHENNTLEGAKSCAVVCPRTEYPNVIKFAKLWHPSYPSPGAALTPSGRIA